MYVYISSVLLYNSKITVICSTSYLNLVVCDASSMQHDKNQWLLNQSLVDSDNDNKTDIITYLSQLTEVSNTAKLISSNDKFPSRVFPLFNFSFTIEYDMLVIYGT